MVQIAMALGLTSTTTAAAASAGSSSSSSNGGGVAKLQKRHVVSKKDKPELSSEAMGLLARVYIQDINLLQFPVSWGNWSGGNRSVAEWMLTLQVAKGKVKGCGGGNGKAKGGGGKAKGGGRKLG